MFSPISKIKRARIIQRSKLLTKSCCDNMNFSSDMKERVPYRKRVITVINKNNEIDSSLDNVETLKVYAYVPYRNGAATVPIRPISFHRNENDVTLS